MKNIKVVNILRKRFTWKIMYINFRTKEARAIYIQFSLKDPWLIPHYEKHFGKADIPLAGWLFFYIGVVSEGIIYKGDENSKIVDNNGNRYYFKAFDNRKTADWYHNIVKNGGSFNIYLDGDTVHVEEM